MGNKNYLSRNLLHMLEENDHSEDTGFEFFFFFFPLGDNLCLQRGKLHTFIFLLKVVTFPK